MVHGFAKPGIKGKPENPQMIWCALVGVEERQKYE
jgi:hypothetical protein